MAKRMLQFVEGLTEPQRVALLYACLGICFLVAAWLQWMENH